MVFSAVQTMPPGSQPDLDVQQHQQHTASMNASIWSLEVLLGVLMPEGWQRDEPLHSLQHLRVPDCQDKNDPRAASHDLSCCCSHC